ncbi:putative dna-(apurinic or apyrimidinic site) lyase 1 protein [Lasiodiplodia theobromae]|uniref:Apurinic-apyrimidinic endonuclease 1 n=1 Tax=Lasiodiplodia theobromae TaxID=45133 RepID=A0A5N5D356_9PEZI|nr:DNA-(apurinic or apyrimidinic site) lyase 1 [Lasiodiplodia theobromae]KAF9634325.1 putative dna-(apurinic or apyrimidinic site) lyase 1 protein [Lasiodiplodia theobromae]
MADESSNLSSPPAETELTTATSIVKAEASTTQLRGKKRQSEPVAPEAKRTKRASRGAKPSYAEDSEEEQKEEVFQTTPKKSKKAVKTEAEEEVKEEKQNGKNGATTKKAPRKRKTKEEKDAEMAPLAARTVTSKLFVGAHVSAAGGVQNAVTNSVHIGGNAFALFLKSQRKWANPAITSEAITMFKQQCDHHKYESNKHVVPHGSYLVNLAHTDEARAKQAYDSFADDLSRCNKLGIQLYNFHPGNAASSTRDEALKQLASQLNRAHKDSSTGTVLTLLETMAVFDGNTIGGTFEELAAVIALIDDKSRVGVCLDTCHVFAAGYDLRTPDAYNETIDKFDKVIGLPYLKAFHINDSKAPLGSGRDLHANIGTGFLGLRAFHNIMNDPRMQGLPMVLETPIDSPDPKDPKKTVDDKGIWAREIKLLESLVGMDVESEEFKKLDSELQERGKSERERVQDQVDRREEKKKAKEDKGAGKKRKGPATVKDMFAKAKTKKAKKDESSGEGSGEESS